MATNKSGLSTGPSSKSASKMAVKFPMKSSSTTASSSRSRMEKVAFAPGDAPPTFIGGMLEPTVVPANPLMHPAPPDPEKTTVPTENSEAQEPSKIVSSKISKAKSAAAPSVKSAASSTSKPPPTKSKTGSTKKGEAESSKAATSAATSAVPTETSTAAPTTATSTAAAMSEKTAADLSALAQDTENMDGATTAISEKKAGGTGKSSSRKKASKIKKSSRKMSKKEMSNRQIVDKSVEKKSPIVQAMPGAPMPDLSVQTDRRKLAKAEKSQHYKVGIDVKTQPIPKVPKNEKVEQSSARKVGDPKSALQKGSKMNDAVPKQLDFGDVKNPGGMKSAVPPPGKAPSAPKKAADTTSAAAKLKGASAVGGAKDATLKVGKPSTGETVLVTSAVAGDVERVAPPEQQNSRRKCIICTATVVGVLLVAICVAAAIVVSRMGGGTLNPATTAIVDGATTAVIGNDDAAGNDTTVAAGGDAEET